MEDDYLSEEAEFAPGYYNGQPMTEDEEDFYQACLAVDEGRDADALALAARVPDRADALFLAGTLFVKQGANEQAIARLQKACDLKEGLGKDMERFEVDYTCRFDVTDDVFVTVASSLRGATLLLAECHQNIEQLDTAARLLQELHDQLPADPVVKLAYADVLSDLAAEGGPAVHKQIVEVVGNQPNETEVHTALLLYKGLALMALGMHSAAKDVFTLAMGGTEGRSAGLLTKIRYNRAKTRIAAGEQSLARADLEPIHRKDPGYEDVAALLAALPA